MTRAPVPRVIAGRAVLRPWGGHGLLEFGLAAGPDQTVGEWWLPTDEFPLLVKIIDARENLSVQLHPDDAAARAAGLPNGKTEAWLVLRAEPGATIYLGLRPGIDPAAFFAAAASGEDVSRQLATLRPRPGDLVFVPPGTLHAIGAGIVLLEVQQNSDTTYRVFDWNREPERELHIDQARRSFRADPRAGPVRPQRRPDSSGVRRAELLACDEFEVSSAEVCAAATLDLRADRPELWFCWRGTGILRRHRTTVALTEGRFCLLPAGTCEVTVAPAADHDRLTVIRMYQP